MISATQAWNWAYNKSQIGPTYAGSTGWRKYMDFLESTAQELGMVDIDTIDIPYSHYIVEDWPDINTHTYGTGIEVESLVSDNTPVPVVASYGMNSGFTPKEGITAPMIYYDPANPPSDATIAGKILVFKTAPYPNPPYTTSFLDSFTVNDYDYRTPGTWYDMYTPPPASVVSSYHTRWVWNQIGGPSPSATSIAWFATIGIRAKAAGMVVVDDLSPDAALGLVQRSVYTVDGKPGTYINCPTLVLDRVNGAKVLVDAAAGKSATLKLDARFETAHGEGLIGYLPGRYYGTDQDQQLMVATHTDAMSLVEEDGGLGMLAIMHYFSQIPQSERPRTIVFYFDCRHFMPGSETAWPQYDYFLLHPEKLSKVVAGIGLEHMGGRQTIETGDDGNTYGFSTEDANAGGLITSFIDLYNNNPWFIKQIEKVSKDNNWPRVDAKSAGVEPGVNGGFQGSVKSPVNKGRTYGFPGVGLAGDWPGCCTQTFAQLQTFDEYYFLQQVASMSQLTGEMMLVDPVVIDFGWGQIKSGLTCTAATICTVAPSTGLLPDSAFITPASASAQRQSLVALYSDAHEAVQAGQYDAAKAKLQQLETAITKFVTSPTALNKLIDGQIAKLPATTQQ